MGQNWVVTPGRDREGPVWKTTLTTGPRAHGQGGCKQSFHQDTDAARLLCAELHMGPCVPQPMVA